MSHPEFLIGLRGGVARGSQPLTGVQGCPLPLLFPRAACGGARTRDVRGTPPRPQQGRTPAPPNIRDDSWLWKALLSYLPVLHRDVDIAPGLGGTIRREILHFRIDQDIDSSLD